jgi:hypothetical protein
VRGIFLVKKKAANYLCCVNFVNLELHGHKLRVDIMFLTTYSVSNHVSFLGFFCGKLWDYLGEVNYPFDMGMQGVSVSGMNINWR